MRTPLSNGLLLLLLNSKFFTCFVVSSALKRSYCYIRELFVRSDFNASSIRIRLNSTKQDPSIYREIPVRISVDPGTCKNSKFRAAEERFYGNFMRRCSRFRIGRVPKTRPVMNARIEKETHVCVALPAMPGDH